MRGAVRGWLVFALVLSGCQSEQNWSFSNGVGLPIGPPPRIVAEVFDAEECGFSCRPEGERRYCHELIGGAPGPAPDNLEDGQRYCFLGTAIDESGEAFAIGCAVVEAGGPDVEITLSAFEESRVIARQCDRPAPVVMLDAATPDAGRDAGVTDAGVFDGGIDSGPSQDAGTPDAGTRPPSGLPFGTAIVVQVTTMGPGDMFVSLTDGRPLGSQPVRGFVRVIETQVGLGLVLRAEADQDATFVGWQGSDCGLQNPCDTVLDRSETITAVFE